MMRRYLVFSFIVLAASVVAIACGGGTEQASGPTSTPTLTSTPAPSSTVTPTTAALTPTPAPTPTPIPTPTPLSATQIYARISPSVAFIETPTVTGSGVLIEGGYVITNAHVVWPFEEVRVVFPDGSEHLNVPLLN